ncbi:MAG: hypothetical protein ACXWE0_10610 [Nitrososphaeraceae archaeon]
MSFQKPSVFINHNNNDDINAILAGTFWLKDLSLQFTNEKDI